MKGIKIPSKYWDPTKFKKSKNQQKMDASKMLNQMIQEHKFRWMDWRNK